MAENTPQEQRIEEVLSFPILLSDQINKSVTEAKIFKHECSAVGDKVDRLRHLLRSLARLSTSAAPGNSFYSHPLRRIASDVSRNLEQSLTLVRKCRRRCSLIRCLVVIVSAADFWKPSTLLRSSAVDLEWVLRIFKSGGAGAGTVISLPPFAIYCPIISWVWSLIAALHMGKLHDKIEAASELASLAKDNDRNKQIIVEEGGVPPLLKLLKGSCCPSSIEAQIAAASALHNLANDIERVRSIIDQSGVPIIVQVLADSPLMELQITVVNLVAKMAAHFPLDQHDSARANAMLCLFPGIISQDWPYVYDEYLMQSAARIAQPLPSLQDKQVYNDVIRQVRSAMNQRFARDFNVAEIKMRVQWLQNRFVSFKFFISTDGVYFDTATKKVTVDRNLCPGRQETDYERYCMVNGFQLYEECVLVFEVKQALSFNSREFRGLNPEFDLQIDDASEESDNEDVVAQGNANNANDNINNVNANNALVQDDDQGSQISFTDELSLDNDSSIDGSVLVDYEVA
ncbi:hypothetical protein ACP275_12G123600 [Erythranthe tilingii]